MDRAVIAEIVWMAEARVKAQASPSAFSMLRHRANASFLDYCRERGIQLDDRNFTLRYSSNIPNQVGLAGSSALITACVSALMGFTM